MKAYKNSPVYSFPDFHTLHFHLDQGNGYFKLVAAPVGFTKMPNEVRLEDTQDPKIKAPKIIRGRQVKKSYTFLTGIRATPFPRLFVGNDYRPSKGRNKRSLVLFLFSEDGQSMTAYYFNGFYVSGQKLEHLLREFCRRLNEGLI